MLAEAYSSQRQVLLRHPQIVLAAAWLVLGCGGDAALGARRPPPSAADAAVTVTADSGGLDAGGADAGWTPPRVVPPAADSDEAFFLSQTGLYIDIADKLLAPDLLAYEPSYALWSDAAEKQRWLRLPEGTRIDTSDMDHWVFPIGTMLFKEFARDGKRLETRLIMRTGPGSDDYFFGAFAWNDDESDARYVPDGSDDVRDTDHEIPRTKLCVACHQGEPGHILGFSAVQVPHAAQALLSHAPDTAFTPPGDDTTAQALGYLHANCGHCHNLHGTAWPDTDMDLRLEVRDVVPEDTATYRTTIDIMMNDAKLRARRVVPNAIDLSGVYFRMSMRGQKTQMPPFASKHVDERGLAAIEAWIESL